MNRTPADCVVLGVSQWEGVDAVLAGFEKGDPEEDGRWSAAKIAGLWIFEDDAGKINRSVAEIVGGGVLLVPNFTLAGDVRKGRCPSFDHALEPAHAAAELERLMEDVRGLAGPGVRVERGEFRSTMRVSIENDGPVTIIVDSRAQRAEQVNRKSPGHGPGAR